MSERVFKQRSIRNVDWKRTPRVEGRVVERGAHTIDEKEREFVVLDDGVQLHRVYESADLKDLFKNAEVGDSASVEFVETVQLKVAGRKLNRFNSAVWTDPKVE